jgi:6-phosphogluconolactonase
MICTYKDYEALSQAAAEFFTQKAEQTLKEGDRFSVALSGGSTPRRTYELLAEAPFRDRVAWSQVFVFWGDERCVPASDLRSNWRMARETLLDHVPISPGHIYPILCSQSPESAAREYEAKLRSYFAGGPARFDLVLLGLGENGHTASLFPGTPVLKERIRWVSEVYVPEQALYRVTLTAPVINDGAVVVFLVSGKAKANVLKEVLERTQEPLRLPAQLIHPENGEIYWFIDQEAGTGLKENAKKILKKP